MCDPDILPDAVALSPGEQVDRFEILEKLGEGAFGIVYKANDTRSKQVTVLKILKSWTFANKDRTNLIKRFKLEFETGQIGSDYLVRSSEYGCYYGNPYIVMEFCANKDLRRQIRDYELSEAQIKSYSQDILQGLHALHSNGKTHRDLKPENVLLTTEKKAKLTDFGIVGHANMARLTQMDWFGRPTEIFGTPAYMPPEQLDPRSKKQTILPTIDIFAFGVIAYEMFTNGGYPFGVPPQDDKGLIAYNRRVLSGLWDDPRQYRPDMPEHWVEILSVCLKADLKQRYQTAEEVLGVLGQPLINSVVLSAKTVPMRSRTGAIGLQVMQGEEHGKIYNLTETLGNRTAGVLMLGWRDNSGRHSNDIGIVEELSSYISRAHATIERHGDHWQIRDGQYGTKEGVAGWFRSMNGTYVNGNEVTDNTAWRLSIDDIITVGNTTLKVVVL